MTGEAGKISHGSAPQEVLIVEDDEDVREVLTEILTDEGYDVVKAANGAVALDLLREREKPPSLILLDLMMPVMDGWRFLEERNRDTQLADIPIVVMSATTQKLDNLPGAAKFLKKPLNFSELLETVARYG